MANLGGGRRRKEGSELLKISNYKVEEEFLNWVRQQGHTLLAGNQDPAATQIWCTPWN